MAGAPDADPPSLLALRERKVLRTAVSARRAGRPRQLKRLLPETEAFLHDAIRAGYAAAGHLPPELVRSITAGLAAPTWNRYTASIHPWRDFASARGLDFVPADPVHFAFSWQRRARTTKGTRRRRPASARSGP